MQAIICVLFYLIYYIYIHDKKIIIASVWW